MNKLWGGRFEGTMDALIEKLNNSLPFDSRLWREDIAGSIAHATMLGSTGILSQTDSQEIVMGLESLRDALTSGAVSLPSDAEDVHTAVESLLRERIGAVAGRLHTARSRNDQIATDIRLHLRSACDAIEKEITAFQQTLLTLSEKEMETILPGCTHLQHAQPIVLAHHLLAYFWMLDRDKERLRETRKRVNRLPLGAGALAGTGFPIDRQQVADILGFEQVLPNSLDAVADRDFLIEFLAFASILAMHLSRLAEEIILWNTPEYSYILLDDSVTTGSSIMPQKKNPDVAELVRGKTGRIYGSLVTLLTLMKGLPLTYNKDLQEDKEPVFDAIDTLMVVLPALNMTLSTATFQRERMAEAARGDYSTATDLADYLVRQGLPFREAHEVVGRVVRYGIETGQPLEALDAPTLSGFHPLLAVNPEGAQEVVTLQWSVQARRSQGGTAPEAVRAQWKQAEARLKE